MPAAMMKYPAGEKLPSTEGALALDEDHPIEMFSIANRPCIEKTQVILLRRTVELLLDAARFLEGLDGPLDERIIRRLRFSHRQTPDLTVGPATCLFSGVGEQLRDFQLSVLDKCRRAEPRNREHPGEEHDDRDSEEQLALVCEGES